MKCKYVEECGVKKAIFGRKGEGVRYCKKHKDGDMKDLCNKMCEECETVRATFGIEIGKPRFCLEHKTEDMFDVANRKCREKGCNIRPSFGLPKTQRRVYCADHKKENMVDLTHKKCIECGIIACFGIEKPEYCSEHKKENMVDLVHPKCKHGGCRIRASFGLPNGKAEYCSKHKDHNTMVDLVHRKCKYKGCIIQSCFGLPDGKPEYCVSHKTEDMIDVSGKFCEYTGCDIHPIFGYEAEGVARCCAEHAEEDMEDIKNVKCLFEGCKTNPSWGLKDTRKRLYCADHAEKGMVVVMGTPCLKEGCGTIIHTDIREKYKGYCLKHFRDEFPDEPIVRNYKIKQNEVFDFIKITFKRYKKYLTFDKRIKGGKSRKIPDILFRYPNRNIIVEIDENEHTHYNDDYEKERLNGIIDDLNGENLILIRFNPDSYFIRKDGIKKKVKSCWGLNDKNRCVIKYQTEWEERLKKLEERLTYWIRHRPKKKLILENLFSTI